MNKRFLSCCCWLCWSVRECDAALSAFGMSVSLPLVTRGLGVYWWGFKQQGWEYGGESVGFRDLSIVERWRHWREWVEEIHWNISKLWMIRTGEWCISAPLWKAEEVNDWGWNDSMELRYKAVLKIYIFLLDCGVINVIVLSLSKFVTLNVW